MTQSITYVPHGTIPDWRGFSPSIVAQRLASGFNFFSNSFVCANEIYSEKTSASEKLGIVRRIGPSHVYTRFFNKLTKLDPWPLDARLASICNQIKPEVVHAHNLEFPVNRFLRRLSYRPKIVLHAHAIRSFDSTVGEADLYLPVSAYTRDLLVDRGFPAKKMQVLYNGVDTSLFAPASPDERARLLSSIAPKLDPGTVIIGYVGRKQADKGFLDFLLAVKSLQDRGYPVLGLSAGPTPQTATRHPQWHRQEELRQMLLSSANSRNDPVRLIDLPAVPHNRVQSVYKLIDFFVFPSRFIGEQHPLALLEAMSCGCAVISSPIASVFETIIAEENGLVLNQDFDHHDIATALELLITTPDRARRLREQARKRALAFDWLQLAAQLERHYFELLGGYQSEN